MKGILTLLLSACTFTYSARGQCFQDTNFREYICLYPEMLNITDSAINIQTDVRPVIDSMQHYQFMYFLPNDRFHHLNTPESKPIHHQLTQTIIQVFMTHELSINGGLFTGSFRIAQQYLVWGVENQHQGYAIMEILYEKGKIIRKETIPDPTIDPREEMKMW